MEECRGGHLFGMSAAFILGAALGAGLAMLFAPASGEETRRRIKEYGEKTYDSGKEKVQEVIAKAKSRMKHEEPEEA
jgi:gas vesicle protein